MKGRKLLKIQEAYTSFKVLPIFILNLVPEQPRTVTLRLHPQSTSTQLVSSLTLASFVHPWRKPVLAQLVRIPILVKEDCNSRVPVQ